MCVAGLDLLHRLAIISAMYDSVVERKVSLISMTMIIAPHLYAQSANRDQMRRRLLDCKSL